MKLKLARENNVDPMFVVGAEGYMLSHRMQLKCPRFIPPKHLLKAIQPPFVILQPKIPDSYGGYIPGAPGTADVYRNWRLHYELQKVKPEKPAPKKQNKSRVVAPHPNPIIDVTSVTNLKGHTVTPYPKPAIDINATSTISMGSRSDVSNASMEEILSVSTPVRSEKALPRSAESTVNHQDIVDHPCADEPSIRGNQCCHANRIFATPNGNAGPSMSGLCANLSIFDSDCETTGRHDRRRRNPSRSARRQPLRALSIEPTEELEESEHVAERDDSKYSYSTTKKRSGNNSRSSRKRQIPREPSGMDNEMTTHLRNAVLGEDRHLFSSGRGRALALNNQAAHGRLFHSVSNEPLDVEQYNDGYDSDLNDPEELKWRIRVSDKQIFEFIDSLVDDKYFLCLWNYFCALEGRPLGDRDVIGTWTRFVRQHGCELKRAKTEVIMTENIFHCWEHGSLDLDGVMQVFRAFREASIGECNVDPDSRANIPPHFDLPRRISAISKADTKCDGMGALRIDKNEANAALGASEVHYTWASRELQHMSTTSWVNKAISDSEQGLEHWLKEE